MKLDKIKDIQIIDSLDNELSFDWGIDMINAPMVWDETQGEGVKVVVMDTGIDTTHPDFKDKISSVYNFVDMNRDVTDNNGHGTHVAGLIVGEHTGVAPKSELHVLKVLADNGHGTIRSVMDGITHAMNLKADVLSISLGVPQNIPLLLKQRIIQAYESGVTIISATGNNGTGKAHFPAQMNEVIGVGGLDQEGNITRFTNNGWSVVAPSVDVLSTYKDNNYARMTGTSMASPLVAGAVALLISYYRKQGKNLKPSEIEEMLRQNKRLDLTSLIG